MEQEPFQLSLLPRWSINFFKVGDNSFPTNYLLLFQREVVMKEPTDTQSQLEKLPVQEQDLPNDESVSQLFTPERVDNSIYSFLYRHRRMSMNSRERRSLMAAG